MKKYFFLLLLLSLAYLLFYPIGLTPGTWQPPENIGFHGKFEKKKSGEALQLFFKGNCEGCEDIAVDDHGIAFGGDVDGHIIRMDFEKDRFEKIAFTGGRPLGLHFDSDGNLIIADAIKGLLSLDVESGKLKLLTDQFQGQPFGFTDDLEIDSSGIIYFSDASKKFGIHDYKMDLFEHQPNGAVYQYDPSSKETTLLVDQLYFANGVALDHHEKFVLVNETGKYRVTKIWLTGPKKGQKEILIDNLPGFPDGISKGQDGIFWLTLISPRDALLDGLLSRPFLRKIVARLPDFLQPSPSRHLCILGVDQHGNIIENIQQVDPVFAHVASVQEFNGHLYLGSLLDNGLGRIAR